MNIRLSLALLALFGLTTIGSAFAPAPVYREPPPPKVPELYAAMQGTWEISQNLNNGAMMRGGFAIRRVQQQIRIQGNPAGRTASTNNNGVETESTEVRDRPQPGDGVPRRSTSSRNQNVMIGGFGGAVACSRADRPEGHRQGRRRHADVLLRLRLPGERPALARSTSAPGNQRPCRTAASR